MTSEDLVKATYPHARLIYDTDRGRFKIRLELAANSKSANDAWTGAADQLGLTDCTKQQIDEITQKVTVTDRITTDGYGDIVKQEVAEG